MDEALPDILAKAGWRPTEVGSVQVAFEGVACAGQDRAVAILWMQAAFAPLERSSRALLRDADTGNVLASAELPSLERGRAVRWSLPFSFVGDLRRVSLELSAPIAESARRIREPWRLLDTLEMPGLDVQSQELDLRPALVAAISPVLGVAMAVRSAVVASRAPGQQLLRRHAAQGSGQELIVAVSEERIEAPKEPLVELLWEPGGPSFEATRRGQLPVSLKADEQRCACGAVNRIGAEFCHACLGALDTTGGPRPAPTGAPAELAQVLEPTGPGPRCARHPTMLEVLTCPRCGGFHCLDCHPESLRSERRRCPDCRAREEQLEGGSLERSIYRSVALILCGVAALFAVFGVLIPLLQDWGESSIFILAGGVIVCGGLLTLAGLVALTRHPSAGWLSIAVTGLLAAGCLLTEGWLLFGTTAVAVFMMVMLLARAGAARAPDRGAPR